ncbi:hypothetical protein [Haloferula sargassicola]|uniref:Peptidase S54 rhomboid domain-containing protein n=1 Tax=Haloferula sargassicola TaxID=490096 RepID=A0ABP9UK04_9BACT
MRWLERLEDRLHWLGFPGLFKWITILGAIVFAGQLAQPDIARTLAFDQTAIRNGEWWRLITFILDPGIPFGPVSALFFYFAVMIAFLIDNSLESIWPTVRLTLYVLLSWFSLAVALWILPIPMAGAGRFLYMSMFLAFATYFPRYQFLLFFILPVQVRFLAWIMLGGLVLSALMFPPALLLVLAVTLPYLLWVLPDFLKARKGLATAAVKRREFKAKSLPKKEAFHVCETCGRTDISDPQLDFRTMEDGTEFCVEHLPESAKP